MTEQIWDGDWGCDEADQHHIELCPDGMKDVQGIKGWDEKIEAYHLRGEMNIKDGEGGCDKVRNEW